ncbi:hypothetical protein [Clostridium sardiniense]|uniref:hypothetical protein n=1 Tax=Clostridium sardiniense TaxID=29369 RepID=UPI001958DB8F|nr:hypothetical protein [Clostridium sardiniense]MBM7833575.1 hypothetical protein [Clostridium sardiniense]
MEISNELLKTMSMLFVIITIFTLINYIFVALATYRIAKKENVDNPWLSWIPIGNSYILIKLGKGNMLFLAPLIISMFTSGIVREVSMAVYVVYSVYMYYKICDRYEVSFIPIAIGSSTLVIGLFPGLVGLTIPVYLIGVYGQWKLYKGATNGSVNKRKITSKITNKKKK